MKQEGKQRWARKALVLWSVTSLAILAACAAETPQPAPPAAASGEVETVVVGDIEVRLDGLSARDTAYRTDEITFDLAPGEGIEYKYRLEENEPMVYSWESSGPVRSEMHAEADGQAEGTAEFFEVVDSAQAAHGTFTAPFPGIHGWYWLNLNEEEAITVTVRSSGFYSYAMEFRADSRRRYEPELVSEAAEAD